MLLGAQSGTLRPEKHRFTIVKVIFCLPQRRQWDPEIRNQRTVTVSSTLVRPNKYCLEDERAWIDNEGRTRLEQIMNFPYIDIPAKREGQL